jgi:hypothetical protein
MSLTIFGLAVGAFYLTLFGLRERRGRRASESAMATACFGFVTFWPELDLRDPTLNSCITRFTLPGRVICLPMFARAIAIIHTASFGGSIYRSSGCSLAMRLPAPEAFFL